MTSHSATQNTDVGRAYVPVISRVICGFLLLTGEIGVSLPSSTWASVYQCVDHTGRQVLTNRKTGLQNCRVILETATGESKSGPGKKPKSSNQPTDDGTMPPYIDAPPPPTVFPNDPPMPWMPPSPNDASTTQPCVPGFNPLNPMTTAPCTQSDEPQASGSAQPR